MKNYLITMTILLTACSTTDEANIISTGKPMYYGDPDTTQAHQAVVYLLLTTNQGQGLCTGTLISSEYILTAGHCVEGVSSVDIYFGNNDSSFTTERTSSEIIQHPQYYSSTSEIRNDIALIRMSQAAPISITPIPPLPNNLAISDSDEGSLPLTFVGFGETESGQTGTKLYFVGTLDQQCSGTNICTISGRPYQLPAGSISYLQTSGGPCSGDSGGPAFITRNAKEYVVGVTSYGDPDCNVYGVSTKVDSFITWINGYTGTVTTENCTNNVDDDGDGDIDCDDSDCNSNPACVVVPENCTNGIDDDGDGAVDCDDSDCNSNPACSAITENCTNGIDDDGDGLVDCADPNCVNHSNCQPLVAEICTNGIDDDGDGDIDCFDADCASLSVCTERVENCLNYTDDDGDGAADCDDVDCADEPICAGRFTEICDNGIDDDGDGKIDCNDPGCRTFFECTPPIEICNNSIDDDGDGFADCSDADCASYAGCNNVNRELCANGKDDDGDGLVDCADPDCISYSRCSPSSASDTGCSCSSAGSKHHKQSPVSLFILLGLSVAGVFRRHYI
jgi:hypothetical protein